VRPQLQPLLDVEALGLLVIDPEALPAEQHVQSLHTKTGAGGREVVQALPQRRIRRLPRSIADHRAVHDERRARAPLA
jgi:hypothetical protein